MTAVHVLGGLRLAAAALLVDAVVGDPPWLPHPVVLFGKWIAWYDARFNQPGDGNGRVQRLRGLALAVTTVGGAFCATLSLLLAVARVSPAAALALNVWLAATTVAWRGLVAAGRRTARALADGGVAAGRAAVAQIVGRDTTELSESGVVRAAVETLAENTVDAVVAPVFFAVLGGAPLALAYRAANTLDSMVGYRTSRYQDFGRVSARLDDLLNFIPARLAAVLMWLAIVVTGGDGGEAWRIMRRDAAAHPSPNAGIPESMAAGALGVQLGGWNSYGGVRSFRATLGDDTRPLERADIGRTVRMVNAATGILWLILVVGGWLSWLS